MIKEKPDLPKEIVFYCKDCRKIIEAQRVGKKYAYKCPICDTRNVAFGTEKSIKGFYRIKEESEGTKQIPSEKI